MSGDLNRSTIIGRLGGDPVTRTTGGGVEVVSFSMATSERWKDRDGATQERTEWHRIVIFNEQIGRIAARYLRKGSRCLIEGELQTRKWTKDGVERSVTEIVVQRYSGLLKLLDGRQAEVADRPDPGGRGAVPDRDPPSASPDLDDDVPF
ncbi:single-stranded DNA-binding protein [Sphingobium boeckii]|uniref:Single-stranded DNA-binding protein n=1 Tax=Sphingobium boeckii TaxID=1082345 RepID=A0A7W9AES2_9SPHN|nr:single-stranded DNA-binding protein [Sphingobium boeckii]MBB5684314.1 single-strand DNA-binding protein [Sphingobium boeckii]